MALEAANMARIENQLDKVIGLDDGSSTTLRAALDSGKIDGRYHREFSTRPDTYGVTISGEVGFYVIPKMLWEHLSHLPVGS